ncbi:SPFH domain / Band 7 family protein [Rubripirellula amarantea]|uniref:SPFH domain / Band 7 family protein n=1 Tax=Rubripirellula amarantea TaxID=2527999 RepID=A0A5C5WSL7_9BACT|nr:SPFH domain-containing protein [Rubripirellula amarantea]TWT53490.1 SPFH domain / Band 7 family protein [Rubripirellula amarantea]
MGLFDRLRGELIDIIEWIDDSQNTLVWRFPRHQNEIKNGAQLIVRPGQVAVFVSSGEIADVYQPGHYELTTQNMPIMSTLNGWKYGFASPFKAEVYFVRTTQITDLKWGTPNPIMMRDPEFGPIRIRGFGTYGLRAIDAKALLKEIVGTDGDFGADDITTLLRSIIASSFADVVSKLQMPALDLATKYTELSEHIRKEVCERIDDEYGLDCPQLYVVNISLPEAVEKALDTRTSMGVIGDMQRYQQYQMGTAMTAAAENPSGGGAAEGMGLGVGMAMAHQMGMGLGSAAHQPGAAQPSGSAQQTPPALPSQGVAWHVANQGKSEGPFTAEVMASLVSQGQVTSETMVWSAGMPQWLPASQVPALAAWFAQVPPPPPPAS